MDRKHDEQFETAKQHTTKQKRNRKRNINRGNKTPTSNGNNPVSMASSNISEPLSDFVILHRIGEILISLMDKTLAKSNKYPKEAEIVNEAIKDFINRKLKEIYGFSEVSNKEEVPVTKDEAMKMVREAIAKVKGRVHASQQKTQQTQPMASYISDTYVNPPDTPNQDNYNPHSFVNKRFAQEQDDRGDFSGSHISELAQRLLKG